ncbi:MAG: DUF4139 domain-containing protein [Candidatus Cloacimonetes bacterium]|nr:DUF4139 domain-containing protein [Candidatus Cloacimonadota bacterium]
MNKIFIMIVLILTFTTLLAIDQVTVYNDNFALVRTQTELNLTKGLQSFYFENIPSTIEASSVIVESNKKGLEIFSQNYEYDLANTSKILMKYIGKDIEVITKSDNKFSGKLIFQDFETIGIQDDSGKLDLVRVLEIRNFNLTKLPANFFLKPTLHWRLQAKKKGKYSIDLSYLCTGLSWNVTYNAVWNDVAGNLEINSWVTMNNTTGKAFEDTKLKLVAGEVQKKRRYDKHYGEIFETTVLATSFVDNGRAHKFEEKAFHDFHIYTLSDNVSINNNQVKQLRLYPTAQVKAKSRYEYRTKGDKIKSMVVFDNSEQDGLGKPLPKGIFKIYKIDNADNNMEFIGEDNISHTPLEEEITLTTGNAFDIVGETIVVDTKKISKYINQRQMSVILKNRSKKPKEIIVVHFIRGDWEITKENVQYNKKKSNEIEFTKKLKAGEEFKITWTETVEH